MTALRVGVIGAGRIGKVHTETLALRIPEVTVTAVADVNLEAARELAGRFRIPRAHDDHRRILDDPAVDAVVICSPTGTHARYICESASAGKQIFCEKPVDLTLKAIHDALAAVDRAGVKLMVGFNRRFDPSFAKVQEMVAAGKVGEPHLIRITSRDPQPPPAEYVAGSGGLFLDMAIHDFDMARFLAGSEVTAVDAHGAVLVDPAIGQAGDVDTAVTVLRFASGALCAIDNSRKAVYGYDQRVEVFGSRGMVQAGNARLDTHSYLDAEGEHAALPLHFFMDRYTEAYYRELRAFADALVHDTPVPVGGRDGLLSVAIALAAGMSMREHRPVAMTEIL